MALRTIEGAQRELAEGTISAVDLLAAVLGRLEETEPVVHAWASVDRERAWEAATAADRALAAGRVLGPLHGIPVGLKDVICTAGWPTEGGSAALRGHVPAADATVVTRLREAGAIVLGKTVTHEFAYGQNIPPTRNPWDPGRYPGGSSAGSGVAVAVGSALGAVGTDTGGSVRNPAAINGVVGLKPTNGLVSRHGVLPVSRSLDQVGPLARTTADCAIMLDALAGHDPADAGSLPVRPPRRFIDAATDPPVRARIGIVRAMLDQATTPVRAVVSAACERLAIQGHDLVDVEVPYLEHAMQAGLTIALAESTVWHQPLLRRRGADYAQGTRVMLGLGGLIPAAHLLAAHQARKVLRDALREVFQAHALDAMAGPTLPAVAARVEELTTDFTAGAEKGDDALAGALRMLFVGNVTGLPALSVPCGCVDGLPVGLHLMGRPLADGELLGLASTVEADAGMVTRSPALTRRR